MLSKRFLLHITFISSLGAVCISSTSNASIATDYRDNVDVQIAIAQAISDRYGRGLVLPGSIVDMVLMLVKADPARTVDIVIAAIKANPSQMFPILRAVFKIAPEKIENIVTVVLKTFPEANTLPFIVAIICELERLKLPIPDILLKKLPPKKAKASPDKSEAQKRESTTSYPVKEQEQTVPSVILPPQTPPESTRNTPQSGDESELVIPYPVKKRSQTVPSVILPPQTPPTHSRKVPRASE